MSVFTRGLSRELIDQYYLEFLGRRPESENIYAQLAGASPQELRRGLETSDEYKMRLNMVMDNQLRDLYRTVLGREADAAGLANWKQQFGPTLEPNEIEIFKQAAQPELASRQQPAPASPPPPATPPPPAPSFTRGLSRQLIDQYYQEFLGRNPESENIYTQLLGASPEELRRGLENSEEYKQRLNIVMDNQLRQLYQDVLQREPDPEGFAYWKQQFGQTLEPNEIERFKSDARTELNKRPADPKIVQTLTGQLKDQYNIINQNSGYSYQYPDRLNRLFEEQAQALAKSGITNIYDVGVKTIEKDVPINVIKRPIYDSNDNFTGRFDYLKPIGVEGFGESETPTYGSLNSFELANLKEIDQGESGSQTTTITKVPTKVLINTQTGQPLQTGFREESELRQFAGVDIWGGANLGKGLDLFSIQFSAEGAPIFVPIWQETSDRGKIGQILAVAGMVFAPQLGAYLYGLPAGSAAAAAAGAATFSGATQLALTGKIDPLQLALSAGTAYVGTNIGLSQNDIAFEAGRLAQQGLNSAAIAQNLSAMGVNAVTSNVAASLAASGVSAAIAPALTAGIINGGLAGLRAVATGGDLNRALGQGFLIGAGGELSNNIVDDLIGANNVKSLASTFKLSEDQVRNISVNAISEGLSAAVMKSGNFFSVLGESLLAQGASQTAVNQVLRALNDRVSVGGMAALLTATNDVVNIGVRAGIRGQDITDSIELALPSIFARSAAVVARLESIRKNEVVANAPLNTQILLASADTGTMTDATNLLGWPGVVDFVGGIATPQVMPDIVVSGQREWLDGWLDTVTSIWREFSTHTNRYLGYQKDKSLRTIIGIANATQGIYSKLGAGPTGLLATNVQALERTKQNLTKLISAEAIGDRASAYRILKEAEGTGTWNEILSGFKAFAEDPGGLIAEGMGSVVINLVGGAITSGASLTARVLTQLGINIAGGVGQMKDELYNTTYEQFRKAGFSEVDAITAGTYAQSYTGPNKDAMGLAAAIAGFATLVPGSVEQQLIRRVAAKTATQVASRSVVAGAIESLTEVAQNLQKGMSANEAINRIPDPRIEMVKQLGAHTEAGRAMQEQIDRNPWNRGLLDRGVIGQSVLDGLVGFSVGTGLSLGLSMSDMASLAVDAAKDRGQTVNWEVLDAPSRSNLIVKAFAPPEIIDVVATDITKLLTAPPSAVTPTPALPAPVAPTPVTPTPVTPTPVAPGSTSWVNVTDGTLREYLRLADEYQVRANDLREDAAYRANMQEHVNIYRRMAADRQKELDAGSSTTTATPPPIGGERFITVADNGTAFLNQRDETRPGIVSNLDSGTLDEMRSKYPGTRINYPQPVQPATPAQPAGPTPEQIAAAQAGRPGLDVTSTLGFTPPETRPDFDAATFIFGQDLDNLRSVRQNLVGQAANLQADKNRIEKAKNDAVTYFGSLSPSVQQSLKADHDSQIAGFNNQISRLDGQIQSASSYIADLDAEISSGETYIQELTQAAETKRGFGSASDVRFADAERVAFDPEAYVFGAEDFTPFEAQKKGFEDQIISINNELAGLRDRKRQQTEFYNSLPEDGKRSLANEYQKLQSDFDNQINRLVDEKQTAVDAVESVRKTIEDKQTYVTEIANKRQEVINQALEERTRRDEEKYQSEKLLQQQILADLQGRALVAQDTANKSESRQNFLRNQLVTLQNSGQLTPARANQINLEISNLQSRVQTNKNEIANATLLTQVLTEPQKADPTRALTQADVVALTNVDPEIARKIAIDPQSTTTVSFATETESQIPPNVPVDPTVEVQPQPNIPVDVDIDLIPRPNVDLPIDDIITNLVAGGTPIDVAIELALEEVKQKVPQPRTRIRTPSSSSEFMFGDEEPGYDDEAYLFTGPSEERFVSPLEPFTEATQITPPREPVKEEEKMQYFNYGQPTEIDQILESGVFSTTQPVLSQFALQANAFPQFNLPRFGMKEGGPLTLAAGKIRRDFRDGDMVQGPGDGQSDDIPAMLADGEFVIPADVVAALGNGSNKAGSEKLYQMMHNIRREHRKGKPEDLPAPAKSPLQYIRRAS